MDSPFIGQIAATAINFPPRGWSFCQGQLINISSNTALFSLLGNTFGGDGKVTFALPDLQGRVPIGFGNGPGLTQRSMGEKSGVEAVTLTVDQIPAHTHAPVLYTTNTQLGTTATPALNNAYAVAPQMDRIDVATYNDQTPSTTNSWPVNLGNSGTGMPHDNMAPYLAINYIIAVQGIFPSRP